jgi:hypothetical protein
MALLLKIAGYFGVMEYWKDRKFQITNYNDQNSKLQAV